MKFKNFKDNALNVLLALILITMFIGNATGQSGTSKIEGVVLDQTGAAVPGATVTIKNPATGYSRSTVTKDDGTYNFPGIPPATYVIEIEAANFKKAVNSNAKALTDSSLTVNITVEPGDITAVVDVTTGAIESVVNTQDATIGNTFVPKQITNLPTDLRRVTDLLTLQPGVTREGYTAGARSDQTNVTLDGVDINDQQTGGRTSQFDLTQSTALRLTTEAVEEFRITTTNPNANQGRSSGAQISLVTKGGTNQFHGAGFYFYRPTEFSANDFFNNRAGVERPSLARDVFGGAIGGPIVKDKLFFFYSYEGQRESSAASIVNLVPLPSLGQGIFKFRANGPGCGPKDPDPRTANCSLNLAQLNAIFPEAGINPAALAVFANAASQYPANDATTGDGFNTAGYRFNSPSTISENTHIVRFDWNINDRHQLFARGNYQWDSSTLGGAFNDTPSTRNWSHPYGYAIGHNWTINSNMINNFRYGLTRISASGQGDSSDNLISFRNVFQPLDFSRTASRVNPTINITDDFTWIKGRHTFQFGGNIRLIENKRTSFGAAFDEAVTNGSFYESAGTIIDDAVEAAGFTNIEDGLNL
ncbi:MAG: carboxypeptidase regulatory-like domain-containing protein, partial [Acidobacteria bacterium]|nr:carboxypeptidase regulatory-like domain-containing protein [Acidobacteriota bacterium]